MNCAAISQIPPKTMEQRIRAVANGMANWHICGLEDHGNEIFTEYANSLYNFIYWKEMDFIQGNKQDGNIKIRIFLNASSFPARTEKEQMFSHLHKIYCF